MGGRDPPAADRMGRHPPGDDGALVAGDVIPAPGFQVPEIGFLQPGEAGRIQQSGRMGRRVERRNPGAQKVKQLLQFHWVSFPWAAHPAGPTLSIVPHPPRWEKGEFEKIRAERKRVPFNLVMLD